ncbi:uncharacterized protein GGS25DRAFT_524639 [Hypoxylon fragiforme]|uniref:uncharacterized protein n=1 Tax=Hypoxylon fragiforme TaxID=63214 RepID=UPI0020C723FD|nr:uncharacterized protein GGS25DRAFT_524639 [Hypoxylon fragiforme]KAI2605129.1 hypothetical protein GGS25DRAFT_524639 [Hypoxylon fragiforme]
MAAIVYITFWYPITGPYTTPAIHSTAGAWGPHLQPLPKSRVGELRDTFSGYKHRGKSCDISSLDLHAPVGSICADKNTMLTAMSSGGRIGKDAPYLPRGCDMQWFNTREVCEILGRYSQVILVGDSMLRHVIGALNILIREDLGYGGVTDWNFNEEEKQKCFCNNQFDVHDCSVQGIFSTADVIEHDPLSLVCPRIIPEWNTDLRIEQIVRYPAPEDEYQRLQKAIDPNPSQRKAFVLGHGLWNDLDVGQSLSWLDVVLDTIEAKTKARTRLRGRSSRVNLPVLLVTPNAAGDKKPDQWIVSQGNKALVRFEQAMAVEAAKRRIDHLGTWNMSIQATLYDGVHMDMRGNLLKAMMVINWLNLLEP